jgi:hypothetical protein
MTHRNTLDPDQAAALLHFVKDLRAVLAAADVTIGYYGRLLRGLSTAYHAALVTRNWELFIALLASSLDDLEERGFRPNQACVQSFWRLRTTVHENADLLSPEMLKSG